MNEDSIHVYYPYGGRRFLLHWWTYDERGHIILTTTKKQISEVAKRVFTKHPDTEIKGYYEVDIVAPSKRLQTLSAEQTLRNKISSFHHEIVVYMLNIVNAGKELPLPFASCTKYDCTDTTADETEWARSSHYNCRNCHDTIMLIGMTPDDLYVNYHTDWLVAHPNHPEHNRRNNTNSIPSRAEVADDYESLWYARADFGHHALGITINEVNIFEQDNYSCLNDSMIFFFRRIRDLDPSQLQETLDATKARAKNIQSQLERMRVEKREREKRDLIDTTIAFFRK